MCEICGAGNFKTTDDYFRHYRVAHAVHATANKATTKKIIRPVKTTGRTFSQIVADVEAEWKLKGYLIV